MAVTLSQPPLKHGSTLRSNMEPSPKRLKPQNSISSSESWSDSSDADDVNSLPECQSSEEYAPVPRKLGQRIYELCDKHHVTRAEWLQKSTDWKTIIVLGDGVRNKALKQKLEREVQGQFSEFKFEPIESSGSYVKHLSVSHS